MQGIIQEQISATISTSKLKTLIPSYCRVVKYDSLKGKKSLKDVMGSAQVLIILFNIHNQKHRVLDKPGHFFVLSTRGPEPCVVFSSTGMSPSKEILITHSDPEVFDRILPKGTVFNSKKLQRNRSSNTCWRWCIVFAHLCPMGLSKFQKLFSRPSLTVTNPDSLVTLVTFLSLF